ncbi:nucleotide sugar dehydrogenase [Natronorarus salvus]|uniref:nucleotide sugar dehydrogenase n=1 Tax=Natronorarus salvus TaxID=3117733 RepID=UPI002F26742A
MTDVCVHGLGYVGLPTATLFASAGYGVHGVDVDERVVERIRGGRLPGIEETLAERVEAALGRERLGLSTTPVVAAHHVICVPTPLTAAGDPEFAPLDAASDAVSEVLREGDTVVVESTVPPGTTATRVGEALASSGLAAGGEFSLAYCPETALPGRMIAEIRGNDRVIGGVTDESTAAAVALYGPAITGEIHRCPDPTTAEFVKLLQNTHRMANVALANEFARLADGFGVDSRVSIALANTHPRVEILEPGLGVGGHCLPIDPLFLTQATDGNSLIERALAVNDSMVGFVAGLLSEHLDGLSGSTVTILGVSYKANVTDTRESPALALAERLTEEAATVRLHDPCVTEGSLDLLPLGDALSDADALVLATDHDEYVSLDPRTASERMRGRLVVDCRGLFDPAEWHRHGLTVRTV